MSLFAKNVVRPTALLALGWGLFAPMAMSAESTVTRTMQGHATMSLASNGILRMVTCCRVAHSCETAAICATTFFGKDQTTLGGQEPSYIGFYRSFWTAIPDSEARSPGRLDRVLRIDGPSLAVLYCRFQT